MRLRGGNGELEESTVQRGEVIEELILSGEIVADEHAQLTFPTSGRITWINVVEGDQVKKGQALAKLDTVVLSSALQRARADLRAAEANLEEVHDEVKGRDADETFEEKNTRTAAEVAKDKAYEAVIIAGENLRNSTLVSPFDGLVTYVANPFSGVNVLATQTQIEVINPDTIHFEVSADQMEVVDIKIGEEVKIVLDAVDEKEFTGTVTYVSYAPEVGEVGSVYSVRLNFADLANNGFVYRVGMTGDAHFVLSKKDDVLWVPSGFVNSDSGGDYLSTNNGKDKVYIEVGLEGEDRTEVVGNISEGLAIYD